MTNEDKIFLAFLVAYAADKITTAIINAPISSPMDRIRQDSIEELIQEAINLVEVANEKR